MKAILSLVCILCFSVLGTAQLNMSLVGQLEYDQNTNDIWSYTGQDDTEYAIVGLREGTSIVSLADPSNPVEVAFVPGVTSTWRDIKTAGDYAYIVADQGTDGILIIDLSNLPASVNPTFVNPDMLISSLTVSLEKAHNIYIDENGFAYIAGGNGGIGGVKIFDLSSPENPVFLGATNDRYAHDVFVRGDTLWASEIYEGAFSAYDVSDKSNPVYLGGQNTPFMFTHNAWLSDDGDYLFTTDERANAYVGAYDVSDLSDIKETDRFRPLASEGTDVIPHNVHYYQGWLVVSHYTDGVVIVDAHDPSNLVEVGNYDTYLGSDAGFRGCWGVTPFTDSGLILASDINTGLYVFDPNYIRACYLEGNVTDMNTGMDINNVHIEILNSTASTNTNFFGDYKTGFANSGAYDVLFTKAGYLPKTLSTNLVNGQVTLLDVELEPAMNITINGQVLDSETNQGIPNAKVVFYDLDNAPVDIVADGSGNFTTSILQGLYKGYAGEWTYKTGDLNDLLLLNNNESFVFELDPGIEDVFELDLGWTITGSASAGSWLRSFPDGVVHPNGFTYTPMEDVPYDIGDQCYITGFSPAYGDNNVDNGTTTITSPSFDLTSYTDPYINYSLWFVKLNAADMVTEEDSVVMQVSNGMTTAIIDVQRDPTWSWEAETSIRLSDFINPTSTMTFSISIVDTGDPTVVEAAFDKFNVTDGFPVSVKSAEEVSIRFETSPNPFIGTTKVRYESEVQLESWVLYDQLGRFIESGALSQKEGVLELGDRLEAGIYFLQLKDENQQQKTLKLVKL